MSNEQKHEQGLCRWPHFFPLDLTVASKVKSWYLIILCHFGKQYFRNTKLTGTFYVIKSTSCTLSVREMLWLVQSPPGLLVQQFFSFSSAYSYITADHLWRECCSDRRCCETHQRRHLSPHKTSPLTHSPFTQLLLRCFYSRHCARCWWFNTKKKTKQVIINYPSIKKF